jgi:hypothetical protein
LIFQAKRGPVLCATRNLALLPMLLRSAPATAIANPTTTSMAPNAIACKGGARWIAGEDELFPFFVYQSCCSMPSTDYEIIYLFFYIILPYFPYFLILKQYYNIAIFLPVCVVAPMNVPGTAPAARTTASAVATTNTLGLIAPVKFAPNDVPATAHGTCNLVFLDHCFCLFCLHVKYMTYTRMKYTRMKYMEN